MEKLDKICGQQISFETSTQKLLDEVLWSQDVARKKRNSPAGEKVGKKSTLFEIQNIILPLTTHKSSIQTFTFDPKKLFAKEEKKVLHWKK